MNTVITSEQVKQYAEVLHDIASIKLQAARLIAGAAQ